MRALLLLVILGQVGPNVSRLEEGQVLQGSAAHQIVDPAGSSWVEIREQWVITGKKAYDSTTVFTTRSGEEYVLRRKTSFDPVSFDDSLRFPDGQQLLVTGRPTTKAPDATSANQQAHASAGTMSFGKRQFPLDLETDGDGAFTSKDGREFRASLPPISEDLLEALSNLKRDDLCMTLGLCGLAHTFFEAYRDHWLKDKDNPWELKRVQVPRTPTPVETRPPS